MAQRPFEGAPGGSALQVWEVAALVHAVGDALAARFATVAVRGELSGYSRAASGHCYFNLKDAHGAAALRCAMFRRAASLLNFQPADGDLVELRGRLAVYEPRGELQLIVESMQHAGAGGLYERFLRLKAQLAAEGLFDPARKRPIPCFPRRVGVVSSLAGAALHDVVTALARRAPHVEVIVYPSPVQGVEAPAALAAAIATAGARAEVDLLLVCRGGGSLEDLWAFNEAVVVRAIAACPLPVIAGIGHETDVSLADFAADLRAPTPTAAAELAAMPCEEALAALRARAAALLRGLHRHADGEAQRLDRLAARLARPAQVLMPHRGRLALLAQRQGDAARRLLERRRQALDALAARVAQVRLLSGTRARQRVDLLAARLAALDPAQVVARGYALVETGEGALVVDPDQLQAGGKLRLTLAHGRAEVRLASAKRR